jgi:hypothetical protein
VRIKWFRIMHNGGLQKYEVCKERGGNGVGRNNVPTNMSAIFKHGNYTALYR